MKERNHPQARPVMHQFITYKVNTDAHRGEVVAVDFKVKGKIIEYVYTRLKTRYHDAAAASLEHGHIVG
jgi:hypothetical protein